MSPTPRGDYSGLWCPFVSIPSSNVLSWLYRTTGPLRCIFQVLWGEFHSHDPHTLEVFLPR
jgi:hypothetical protein